MSTFAPNSNRRIVGVGLLICISTLIVAGCSPNTPGGTNSPPANPGPENNPPTVNAGDDQVANSGANVTLDGSASSDPDGDQISFSWRQALGTSVSLSSTFAAIVTFTAPANGTLLTFELTVSDGQSDSVGTVHVSVLSAEQSPQVIEVRQRSILDDPAVSGDLANGWILARPPEAPPNPPDFDPNKGAFALLDEVQFAPLVEDEMSPGATREIEVQIGGPSVLLGSVRWEGTTSPLDVALALDGSRVATGVSYSFGPDRGGSSLDARTTAGGRATLSVTNTSADTINVRITLGALGL